MHIMGGYLPPLYAAVWTAAAAPAVIQSVRSTKKTIAEKRSTLLLLGVAAGFCFVLSALKMPSVTGSTRTRPAWVSARSCSDRGPWSSSALSCSLSRRSACPWRHHDLGGQRFSMAIVGSFTA